MCYGKEQGDEKMREQAKITSKGQITVPRQVRHALGVKPGDSLVFEQDGEEVCVRPVRKQSAFAKYRGIGNPGMASGREAVLRKIDELRGHEAQKK
jgi:AbrB family looped-hinge helix DNA binding protein